MSVHVFRAREQPATHFSDDNVRPRLWVRYAERKLLWCWSCRKRRWAKNLVVQVYYDSTRFFCREGRGCKKAHERRAGRGRRRR